MVVEMPNDATSACSDSIQPSRPFRAGELAQALPTYTHPAVLVVDEVGYLTYGTDAANSSSTSSTSGIGAIAR
jgi:hypothetical protein